MCLLTVSGGEASEDGVAVSDCQTAAAAAVGGGSQLSHGISPALGYYLLPGYQSPYSSGVYNLICECVTNSLCHSQLNQRLKAS